MKYHRLSLQFILFILAGAAGVHATVDLGSPGTALAFSVDNFGAGAPWTLNSNTKVGTLAMQNNNARSKRVYVSDVDELYAAVNNPDNVGARVVLAPGTYVLSADYPNGGRLELQTDMTLQGQPGKIGAVLIDQSSLPFASFRLSPTVTTAPIRMGRGTNSLEWLSVKGGDLSANPLSVIESDLPSIETNVIISHVYVDANGSRIGILLRNRLQEHENRVINATLEYSEIANTVNTPPAAGLALQNRISGSQIRLNMIGNYIHGNRIGILNFNGGLGNAVEHCSLDMRLHNDRIEGNGNGMDLSGGTSQPPSNNNTVTFTMYGGSIRDNGQPHLTPTNGALLSGIYAAGAYGSNDASDNTLSMSLWGTDISNNGDTDIYAYGAFSPTAFIAGINNRFDLYLYGRSADATIESAASVPFEPAGTNIVNIVRN